MFSHVEGLLHGWKCHGDDVNVADITTLAWRPVLMYFQGGKDLKIKD